MNTLEYIKEKQKEWAVKKNITLIGSKGEKGECCYTKELRDNLFQNMSESTRSEFLKGDGKELGNGNIPGKMQAVHSSSVTGVNFFDFWKDKNKENLASSIKIPSKNITEIKFEEKFPILKKHVNSPNIDVCIHYNNDYLVGMECKYTEPFNSIKKNKGLNSAYLQSFEYWDEFPEIEKYAKKITPIDKKNKYLDAAQLIRHVLGMYSLNKNKNSFRLVYIYLPAFMENNDTYVEEIEELKDRFNSDGIKFQYISWQEIIINMKKSVNKDNLLYYNYLAERYL